MRIPWLEGIKVICDKRTVPYYMQQKIQYLHQFWIKYALHQTECIIQIIMLYTYVHSYSFQRSTHSKGSEHMTLAQGLLEGQCLSKLRAMVACPHWVPFIAGGRGRCFPSNLISSRQPETPQHYVNMCYNSH